jgi:hypothetical protein
MPRITPQDVGDIVKKMNAMYQPPDGRCAATPEKMDLLVTKLEAYTKEVQKQRHGDDPDADLINYFDISWGSASQWANDMAHWQARLGRYRQVLDEVPKSEWRTVAGCKAIYSLVTAPLLDGIYYEVLPGIVLNEEEKQRILMGSGHPGPGVLDVVTLDHPGGHSNPKPPDVSTPYSLGNGILIFQEFQRENFARLLSDLNKAFKDAIAKVTQIAFPVAAVGIGLVVVGAIGYALYKAGQAGSKPERYD